MSICRDCKEEKEIKDRGRCEECLLAYYRDRQRCYTERNGIRLIDKICINCFDPFKAKNDNTKYCTVCSEFFHENLGTPEIKSYKNRTSQIVNKVEFGSRKIEHPSKEQLEKMVWSKPTTILAKELGVSDVAISKWCKQAGVKKPERGYWAKHQM